MMTVQEQVAGATEVAERLTAVALAATQENVEPSDLVAIVWLALRSSR
jgi:hypothetical protein